MGNPNCCFMIIAGIFFFYSQSTRETVNIVSCTKINTKPYSKVLLAKRSFQRAKKSQIPFVQLLNSIELKSDLMISAILTSYYIPYLEMQVCRKLQHFVTKMDWIFVQFVEIISERTIFLFREPTLQIVSPLRDHQISLCYTYSFQC